jgi:hypothetical protein
LPSASSGKLLAELFDFENGGDTFAQKRQPVPDVQGITSQKTALFIATAVRASNPILSEALTI